MKQGVYLGRPVGRVRNTIRWFLITAICSAVLHGIVYFREVGHLNLLRSRIEPTNQKESLVSKPNLNWTPDQSRVLALLYAVSDSGATYSYAPTKILWLLDKVLPTEVKLVSVILQPSLPRPNLVLEVLAKSEIDVSTLERKVSSAKEVSETQLIEERRTPDGLLSIRMRVDLLPEGVQ